MSGFYFSFTFKSSRNIRYFLPLKLITNVKDVAERYYTAMKTAIADRYEIISSEEPICIITDINSEYVNDMLSRPFRGKLVTLKAAEWEFVDFEPELELSFDENLGNAINSKIQEIDWLGIDLNNNCLARLVTDHKFPVQVIDNPDNNSVNFLAIQLVSAE